MSEGLVFVLNLINTMIVYSIPLLYGTMGEILVEKSGSLNLGVEGTMVVGALFGCYIGTATGSVWLGLLLSIITGALCGLIFAWLTVSMQANQNVTGLTISTFGTGLYFFIGHAIEWGDFKPLVDATEPIKIPLLGDIPVVGEILFDNSLFVYAGVVLAVIMWWYLNRTCPGLKLRAIGENPAAADSCGINIKAYKYIHICIGSAIMGIGGYYMGCHMGAFVNIGGWVNGYGWIAVALVIFANWNPARAILGTVVFGLCSVLEIRGTDMAHMFPSVFGWLAGISPYVFKALPFIVTAVVLIIESVRKNKKSGLPAAMGMLYFREDR